MMLLTILKFNKTVLQNKLDRFAFLFPPRQIKNATFKFSLHG